MVDDDPAICELCKQILTPTFGPVVCASEKDEAIKLFDQHQRTIRLLITDVVMPEIKGPALAKELQKKKSDLKILFMSGHSSPNSFNEAVLAGKFLNKPFAPGRLIEVVRKILTQAQA